MPRVAAENPFLIFVITLVVLFAATFAGGLIAKVLRPIKDEERPDLTLVINGSLVLLTLITSLTYYFAMTKHDQRKACEIAEADAIATEHFRAGLLPTEEMRPLRALILQYLDQRISFYTLRDARPLEENDTDTQKLRAELWLAVQVSAKSQATSNTDALLIDGMNGVLNSRRDAAAAWNRHMPNAGWSLMYLLSITPAC